MLINFKRLLQALRFVAIGALVVRKGGLSFAAPAKTRQNLI